MVAQASSGSTQEELEAKLRGVLDAFRASGTQGEDERHLPRSVFEAMEAADLFRIMVPEEYGGEAADISVFMRTIERLAREDGALGWNYAILAGGGLLAAYLPEAGAREVYSDGANQPFPGSVIPSGRADVVPGGYRLTGRWPLASGSQYGQWIGATALIFDGETPLMAPTGAPDIHSMGVRREDCQFFDTWHSIGLKGSGSWDFAVSDVFVPETMAFSVFGTPSQVAGPVYRAGPLVLFSLALAGIFPGIARRAIDEFVALAMKKTPTLSQTGLAARPTIHAEVAKAEALVQSSQAFLYAVADEITKAVASGEQVSEELEARRRLACTNVAAACRQAVDNLFNLAGSTPVYSGHALERCLRDIHTASQHLVVSPVWWEKTGQYYFGHGLGMP